MIDSQAAVTREDTAMPLDPRALSAEKRFTIEGLDFAEPWRVLYADRSEIVLQTVTYRLLVSTCDVTEVEPGRLRLERQR